MKISKLGRSFIVFGTVMLLVTASLHLAFGLPPLLSAVDKRLLTDVPGMKSDEIIGIWVSFSILLFSMAGALFVHVRRMNVDWLLIFVFGTVPISAGITMFSFNLGVHISVPLLVVPGVFICFGGILVKNAETTQTKTTQKADNSQIAEVNINLAMEHEHVCITECGFKAATDKALTLIDKVRNGTLSREEKQYVIQIMSFSGIDFNAVNESGE